MNNHEKFVDELTTAYTSLFQTFGYAYAASRNTPSSLAVRMAQLLRSRTVDKNSEGIKMACKAVGIKHTYKDIEAYLKEKSCE